MAYAQEEEEIRSSLNSLQLSPDWMWDCTVSDFGSITDYYLFVM